MSKFTRFLGGPNWPKICGRGTKFDFKDWAQEPQDHTSYKSPAAMVYFFQAAALSCTENAKFGAILAHLAILWRIYILFGVLFTGPKIYKYQVCPGLILNTTCIDNWWLTTFCMVWFLSTWFILAWDFLQIFLRISSKSGGFNQFGFLLSWLPFSPSPRNFTPAAVTIFFEVLWRWRR